MKRLLIIDGDIIAYRIATMAEKGPDWDGDGNNHAPADADHAIDNVRSYVRYLEKKLNAAGSVVCMSDPTRKYFRHKLDKNYKLNRTSGSPPSILNEIRDAMRVDAEWREGLEGDDVCTIFATKPKMLEKYIPVIVSDDKDLRQLPGKHCIIRRGGKDDITTVTPEEGRMNFWRQVLTGDVTDGVKGLPGVGPVTANKVLSERSTAREHYNDCKAEYGERRKSDSYLLKQIRLLYLLRNNDYSNSTGNIRLWLPETHLMKEHV